MVTVLPASALPCTVGVVWLVMPSLALLPLWRRLARADAARDHGGGGRARARAGAPLRTRRALEAVVTEWYALLLAAFLALFLFLLPVAFLAFLIGTVLALNGASQLRQFGAVGGDEVCEDTQSQGPALLWPEVEGQRRRIHHLPVEQHRHQSAAETPGNPVGPTAAVTDAPTGLRGRDR